MKLKFDHTATEALAQIERSQYARSYAMKGKSVTMVGIGFNVKKEQNITDVDDKGKIKKYSALYFI